MKAVQVKSIVAGRTMQVTATVKQLQRELGGEGEGYHIYQYCIYQYHGVPHS